MALRGPTARLMQPSSSPEDGFRVPVNTERASRLESNWICANALETKHDALNRGVQKGVAGAIASAPILIPLRAGVSNLNHWMPTSIGIKFTE